MKKLVRRFIIWCLYSKLEREYMAEALCYDYKRMFGSKEALRGRYDTDMKINSKISNDFK